MKVALLCMWIACAALVWGDSRRHGFALGRPEPGAGAFSPWAWAAGTVLLPVVFLPLYVVMRYRFLRSRRRGRKSSQTSA